MSFSVVKDTERFLYILGKFGEVNQAVADRLTDEDKAKADSLKSLQYQDISLVARDNSTGEYGIILETSEYHHVDSGGPDEHLYDGTVIGGRLLTGSERPTLEEAIAHCSIEADKLSELYPDLLVEVRHGDNTWDGAVMLVAFISENSGLIDRVPQIGDAMLDLMRDNKSGYAAAPAV